MNLNLTPEEARILGEFLAEHVNQLEIEINRTDALSFKHDLRQRVTALEEIARRLGALTPAGQAGSQPPS